MALDMVSSYIYILVLLAVINGPYNFYININKYIDILVGLCIDN